MNTDLISRTSAHRRGTNHISSSCPHKSIEFVVYQTSKANISLRTCSLRLAACASVLPRLPTYMVHLFLPNEELEYLQIATFPSCRTKLNYLGRKVPYACSC
ncbi:hypothetical protein BX600DRAFT_50063 [Xylariales sp. PMI_506]|nr:hypothetical protein BX600DRAFT_50063 [Xylariales sp. PMI_506]